MSVFPQYPVPTCCYLQPCCTGIRGNADYSDDGLVNILDVTFLINYLYKGGPEPECFQEADVDYSLLINIMDVTYLINWLYKGGPIPLDCAQ